MSKFFTRNSLRKELIISHLSIAIAGVILLGICLFNFIWLKQEALYFTDVNLRLVRIISDTKMHVQQSLAAVRGWVVTGEKEFITERDMAWKNGINPDLRMLMTFNDIALAPDFKQNATKVSNLLDELALWQWRIEDISQTPGNNNLKHFYETKIIPTEAHIESLINALIAKVRRSKGNSNVVNELYQLKLAVAKIRKLVQSDVHYYVNTNQDEQIKIYFDKALFLFNNISSLPQLSDQKERLELLNYELKVYDKHIKKVAASRNENRDIAKKILSDKAAPIARDISDLLTAMLDKQTTIKEETTSRILSLTNWYIYGLIIAIALLILFSIWLADFNARHIVRPLLRLVEATKKMAQNKLKDPIQVNHKNEIGALSESFNDMFMQRKYHEQKINGIIDTALDAIITINTKGIIISCNDATSILLGYTKQELIDTNVSSIMPSPHSEKHDGYIESYLETKKRTVIGKTTELEVKHKSGEIIPVRISVNEIRIKDEVIFAGIIHDIRQEILRNNEITISNANLQKELNYKKIDGELDDALRGEENPKSMSQKVLKYFNDHYNVLLSAMYLVLPGENKPSFTAANGLEHSNSSTETNKSYSLVQKCYETKSEISLTDVPSEYFYAETVTGHLAPKYIYLFPLRVDDEIIGVIELCTTQAFEIEIKNHIQKHLIKVALHYKAQFSNIALKQLLAKTEEQRQELAQQEEELRASNEELETQTDVIKQSEEELRASNEELESQISVINTQKTSLSEQAEELTRVSKYKSEFLANVSHELRTPLNSLLVLAQSFIANKQGNLTPEQQEEAQVIHDAGNDLLKLINDILDISKVEAGKINIEMLEIRVSDLIFSLERQFKVLADEKQIDLSIVDETNDIEFTTDQMRVLQILKNLLSNAIKFTETGRVSLTISNNQEQIIFKVSDTGIGIPEEKLDTIFSQFEQVDGSITRKYGGTGLGLAISQKLTDLLSGEISVESELNKGSIFTLTLPITNSESQNKHSNQSPSSRTEYVKPISDNLSANKATKSPVILVHSALHNSAKICEKIKNIGFEPELFQSGEDAISLALSNQIKAIILTTEFDDITIDSLIAKLNDTSPDSDILVHVITQEIDEFQDIVGDNVSLQKYITLNSLEDTLSKLKGNNNYKVLIAENDTDTQSGITKALNNLDLNISYDVITSLDELEQLVKNNDYFCTIFDIDFSGETSFDLVQTIRKNSSTPIIAFANRDISEKEYKEISAYTPNIITKGDLAIERMMDEVQLFIHHLKNGKDNSATKSQNNKLKRIRFNKERVLIVDDDLRNTFSLSHILESDNLEVVIADNGKLALEKVESEEIDIVLMDIMMPIMDGLESMKKIRQSKQNKRIPIIAVTAKASEQDKKLCLDAGADDYMSKPVDTYELTQKIHTLLCKGHSADD